MPAAFSPAGRPRPPSPYPPPHPPHPPRSSPGSGRRTALPGGLAACAGAPARTGSLVSRTLQPFATPMLVNFQQPTYPVWSVYLLISKYRRTDYARALSLTFRGCGEIILLELRQWRQLKLADGSRRVSALFSDYAWLRSRRPGRLPPALSEPLACFSPARRQENTVYGRWGYRTPLACRASPRSAGKAPLKVFNS